MSGIGKCVTLKGKKEIVKWNLNKKWSIPKSVNSWSDENVVKLFLSGIWKCVTLKGNKGIFSVKVEQKG